MKRTTADTHLFIHAADPDSPHHAQAREFFDEASLEHDDGEFVQNPTWRCVDYDTAVSVKLWQWASATRVGFRRIIDARLGLTLRHHGVTQLATVNTKDFQEFGFQRVWNPLVG